MLLLSWVVSNVILALVLALAAWVVQRWLLRPAIAHILWVLVLVKLVTPALVSVPLGQTSDTSACATGTCGCDHHSPTQTFAFDTLPWILLAVWAVGAGTTACIARHRWAHFRRLMTHARPASPEWQLLAARLASELSIRCPPEVLEVPGRLPPLVIPGWHRPRLLLPKALLSDLSDSQRDALLLHELVHIKRGDHRVRMLELTVGILYWWLPIVGSIGRQLRACEEACCDEAVVTRLPEARRDYATLLLDVIDFTTPSRGQPPPQAATAMSAADGLEKRIRAILDATPGMRRSQLCWALVAGLTCAILPCELHYDFVGRPTRAAVAIEREPDAEPTDLPGDECEIKPAMTVCCPS